jgi:hypothetical protein
MSREQRKGLCHLFSFITRTVCYTSDLPQSPIEVLAFFSLMGFKVDDAHSLLHFLIQSTIPICYDDLWSFLYIIIQNSDFTLHKRIQLCIVLPLLHCPIICSLIMHTEMCACAFFLTERVHQCNLNGKNYLRVVRSCKINQSNPRSEGTIHRKCRLKTHLTRTKFTQMALLFSL